MKISLEWQDKFNTGVEEIDYQHRYFLRLIKRFGLLTEEKLDENYLNRLLKEISSYAVFHFISEENMMIRNNYPLLSKHQKHHEDLILKLDEQITALQYDKQSLISLIAFLANWFMNHTVEEDQKFALFLLEKSS